MNQDFRDGVRTALPIIFSFVPFGLLFGALAVDQGLSVGEAVLMSATIFGGASQMVGIELFGQKVSPALLVLSVFAVNFRHILYSAAIGRRIAHFSFWQKALAFFLLTDPQFAESEKRAEAGRKLTMSWYLGLGLANYAWWQVLTLIGALFGSLVPDTKAFGLDFLLPIYFLGLLVGFRRRPNWLAIVMASAVASVIAFDVIGSPWHIACGAVAGIALAAMMPPKRAGEAAS